ncbi:MAG: hypothetical protein JXR68_02405 [Bacteroidales bacterium]|nr:hypothetical protein [Bacteroidales bacterium]
MTLKDLIINYLIENKELFTTHKAYIFPDIPAEKLSTVKENQKIGENEQILWVVDLTLSGKADNSLIFTETGIYYFSKLIGVVTEKNVLWAEISDSFYDKKRGFVIIKSTGDELVFERMHFDVFYKKEDDLIDARVKLLQKVKDFVELKPQEIPVTNNEKDFIEDIKFMLYNDGIIEETEKSILTVLKNNYNIDEIRAQELIKSAEEEYQTSPEKMFIDEVNKILDSKAQISESENRALDFFAQKLNLNTQTVQKLKQIAVDKKQIY